MGVLSLPLTSNNIKKILQSLEAFVIPSETIVLLVESVPVIAKQEKIVPLGLGIYSIRLVGYSVIGGSLCSVTCSVWVRAQMITSRFCVAKWHALTSLKTLDDKELAGWSNFFLSK